MQIFEDVEQGTQLWHDLRCGIPTMSKIGPLTVKGRDASGFGSGALTYMNQLIAERITGKPDDDWKGNRDSERGHLLEPVVRDIYIDRFEVAVKEVGFILNHSCGFSPDGLVGSDGLIEIKTKKPHLQCQVILDDVVPAEHYDQCMGGLWLAEREWIDFISYSEGMPLFIKRLYRDEAKIREYTLRSKAFLELLEIRMEKILGVDLGVRAAA